LVNREISEQELVLLEAVKKSELSIKDVLSSLSKYYAGVSKDVQCLGVQAAIDFRKLSDHFDHSKEVSERLQYLKLQMERYGFTPILTRAKQVNEAEVVLTETDVKTVLPEVTDALIMRVKGTSGATAENMGVFEVTACCSNDVRMHKFLGMRNDNIVIFGMLKVS